MIKRIKSSLFTKVFLLTTALLLCVCFLVFGILASIMPNTYSTALSTVLDEKVLAFVSELEQVSEANAGQLFDQFVSGSDIISIKLYDGTGTQISPPTAIAATDEASFGVVFAGVDDAPILSNQYYFSYANSDIRNMLVVDSAATQVTELQNAFKQVFPMLLIAIVFISLLTSAIYSRIITRPVLNISAISEKMSELQLTWQLEEKRSDELGMLEKSLNTLSHKLSAAMSDLQIANAKLEQDIEMEKALEQAQLDFFSAVSHELKTPITIIKGQLEGMLLGIGSYKDHEKYLSRSLDVANALEKMVQEILTVSRLEKAMDAAKNESFEVTSVIRDIFSATEDLIIQKELKIELNLPNSAYCTGNKVFISKVFTNLIGNAVVYSPNEGTIHAHLNADGKQLQFEIENACIHIPEELIPHLFEAFYRIDSSRSRRTGGSGLGLYLVQKILEQYGSQCCVQNTADGVRFSFTL